MLWAGFWCFNILNNYSSPSKHPVVWSQCPVGGKARSLADRVTEATHCGWSLPAHQTPASLLEANATLQKARQRLLELKPRIQKVPTNSFSPVCRSMGDFHRHLKDLGVKSMASRAHAAKQQRHVNISLGEHARLIRVRDVTSVIKLVPASLLAFCKRILVPRLILVTSALVLQHEEPLPPFPLAARLTTAGRRMPGAETSKQTPSSVTKRQPATKYYPNWNLRSHF